MKSLENILGRRAAEQPEREAFSFVRGNDGPAEGLTYAELDRRARAVAVRLRSVVESGDRALLLYPPGLDFAAAFYGCLYAGVVAVPAPPPDPARLARTLPRIESILGDARPAVVLTTSEVAAVADAVAFAPAIATDEVDLELAGSWRRPAGGGGETLAYLQFTSGSTSAPKGVMGTRGNLLHNCRALERAWGYTPESVAVLWVPNFHDDGLVHGTVLPVFTGHRAILMSPLAVVRDPECWLRAISRFRATHSGGPNFIYSLAARKVGPEARRDLDLANWRMAYNAAEPIRHETLVTFHRAFAPCGFRWDAFYPAYGLAETTLLLSTRARDSQPVLLDVDADALERRRVVERPAVGRTKRARRTLVSSGRPIGDTEVKIVDPGTRQPCAADEVGEIWVTNPSVARGYWQRTEATEETFRARLQGSPAAGPFLRTGDLGFLAGGELFVTGRFKDLILVRGRNVYPQDVEATVEASHPRLRPGCCAAFSVEAEGEERLAVVAEVGRKEDGPAAGEVIAAVRRAVAERHELALEAVTLLAPGGVLKTSSGKIRRRACRQAFLEQGFRPIARWSAGVASVRSGLPPAGPSPEDLSSYLRDLLARELGLRPAEIDPDEAPRTYGIDSLKDVELANRVRDDLGLELAPASFLAAERLGDLVRRLETAEPKPEARIPRQGRREDGRPLSPAQDRLYFLDRLMPGNPSYNVPFFLSLAGPLSPALLAAVLGELVRRHETLRTVFSERSGQPLQTVRPWSPVRELPRVDLGALPPAHRGHEAHRMARREAVRPFDLEAGPLWRAPLLILGEEEHLLLLAVHHISVDGASLGVLYRELGILYEAFRAGRPSPLPRPPVSYSDYAAWHRQRLAGERAERLAAEWREELRYLPVLELPADRPRPAVKSSRGESFAVALPAATSRNLRELGRRCRATPAMTLLTAFGVLLARAAAQARVVVGTPVANRGAREVEGLVGCFVNVLPLPLEVPGDSSFRELLGGVREKALRAWARQELPFEVLVEKLGLARELSRNPLFQVIFAPQSFQLDPLALGPVTVEPRLDAYQPSRFDLELHLWDRPRGFSGFCSYDVELFDATTVSRLTRRFAVLAGAVAEDPGRRTCELPWLAAAERHQLVAEWNDAPPVGAVPSTIFERFAATAAQTPDGVALLGAPDDTWSYGELADRARRLARVLAAGSAVGPETRVGLFLEPSPEAVAAILGILAAGGAYVPLDPSYPVERLAYILEDSGAAVLLFEERLLERLPETAVPRLTLERAAAVPERDGRGPDARPENLAYVIYTSGSTGKPKGVGISHANVMRLFSATAPWFRFGAGDVRALFHSVAFDFSVWEIFGALLHGGRLVIVPWETRRSPEAFYELLRDRRINVLDQTPSAFEALLGECGERPPPPSLRTVVFGGEALDPRRLTPWKAGPRFVNMYGITETTVHVTYRSLAGADLERDGSPIGRPIPDLDAVLLTGGRDPAPFGVPGEIFVGGAGLARGYLGRGGLTAERFVPDPFAAAPGARLYKSGDLARRRADGGLDYLGRADHQVKIRGYRLELGEVEAVLRRHPAVREASVTVDASPRSGARLVAYVAGTGAAPRELRSYLRRCLPEYMVPALWVELEALPRLPNGKIDRAALAPPRGSGSSPEAPAPPGNGTESAVAAIWCELLGLERIAPEDNFFDLGGHSLLLLEVRSRLETLGARLPLARLFAARTVAAMARIVDDERRVPTGDAGAIPVQTRQPEDGVCRFPASFAQNRLWFLERLGPRRPHPVYHLLAAFKLTGPLLASALEHAVAETSRRQESLRTTFAEIDGEPWQVIRTEAAILLPVVDLAALPPPAREIELRRRARIEHDRPFDLDRGPLWRFLLLRVSGGEHLLLAAHHHIVSDGWSFGVLGRELAAHYEAAVLGRRSPLPAPPVQYADFAVWQRKRQSRGGGARLAWWKQQMAGAPPVLELPADRPRRPVQRFRGGFLAFASGVRTAVALTDLGRRESVSPAMTLLAAFQVLLCRQSGAEKLVVGTPAAGRWRLEVEGLIGFFVNNLPLLADLSERPAFRRLLGRVRETTLAAQVHQDLPFESLVEELAPARDLSHNPLFQVVFAFQNAPAERMEVAGLEMRPELAVFPSTRFDLELHLWQTPRGLEGIWAWDLDLFDATTVARLSGRWQRLLADVVRAPEATPDELGGPSAAERHQLAVEWNDTGSETDAGALWALFEEQVRRTPEAVAVLDVRSFDGTAGSVSYLELARRSRCLSRRLIGLGVGAETPVGLFLRRSADLVTAQLAVLAAGACYVPLDPESPPDRLAGLLRDAGVTVLVTGGGTAAPAELGVPPRRIVVAGERIEEAAGTRPAPPIAPDNLAYVMYTSGSTGRPKGVAVTQRGVIRLVRGSRFMDLSPAEVFLQLAPPSFDAATLEIWGPILNGGRLVIPPPGRLSLAEIARVLERHRVSALWLTAGLFHLMVEEAPPALAGVRQVLAGGDVLSLPHVRRALEQLEERREGTARLTNGYGPTESTTFTTCHAMATARKLREPVPIGRPIRGTRVRVLDRGRSEAPVGVAGELMIGGAGLARGYHRRPALSAERFVPDPHGGPPGERLYRSGDLARWLADGSLEFLGRADRQVKVRGFRVEPGEIEAVLAGQPAVAEAVVVAPRTDRGERRVVAWVSWNTPPAGGTEALRDALRRTLPAYMVPDAVMELDELPLLPSGKVDRTALARRAVAAGVAEPFRGAVPMTPTEEVVAAVWREVLPPRGVPFTVDEDFFDLGGHSLLAVRVISRLRLRLGVELSIRDLFEGRTVTAVAQRVELVRREAARGGLEATREGHPAGAPLSFAQQRLWLLDRLAPGSPAYSMPFAARLAGSLDRAFLGRALNEIVRRHQVLRTTFALAGGEPAQKIHPPASRPLPVADLTALAPAARAAETRRQARRDAARPFDLERGPLFRASLLALGPGEHVLLVNQHHAVSDGWSLDVMWSELAALYGAFAGGAASPLDELPLQYADYAVWQRGWLAGDLLAAETAWWKARLGGVPPVLELPADRRRPAVQSFRGGALRDLLPSPLAAGLRELGRREGASLTMTLLAGFFLLLHRVSGRRRILVGWPIANRGRHELEGLIGLFVNTLALPSDLTPDPGGRQPSFRDFLGRVRRTCLAAFDHQDLPFEKLVEELAPARDLSRNPLVQVTLSVAEADAAPWRLPGVEVEPLDLDVRSTHFDLEAHAWQDGGGLGLAFVFDRQLFDPTSSGRLLRHFRRLLAAAGADPGRRLDEIAWLGAAERHQVLAEWSAGLTPRRAAAPEPVVERFLRRAAAAPEALAISDAPVSGEPRRSLSYGGLRRRAGRLGRHLRRLGVGAEVVVAVLSGRSPEMIVAYLAVLEAGGAFLPLDPETPRARREWMLRDSGAALVLAAGGLAGEIEAPPGVRCLLLGDEPPEPEEPAGMPAATDPENLAYVIYTSGSTGRPKGVEISHRGLAHLLDWHQAAYGVRPSDRATLTAAVGFDASVWEIWPYLAAGASLHALPRGELLSPREHLDWLAERRITQTFVSTPLLRGWADVEPPPGLRLRALLTGGDVLRAADRDLSLPLYNHYGPTENTVVATSAPVRAAVPDGADPPIGRPIGRVRARVLDRGLRPVPPRVVGELCLGGESLARGYRGRPAPTAERFVPDPFGAAAGERLYRTGDGVRFLAGGELDFAGRLDRQVKVRGVRVELGEIEGVLASHPAVREAVVLFAAGDDGAGEGRLVGCVLPAAGPGADPTGDLRAHLERELPAAMVPARLITVESFPRTASGKIDRRALARRTASVLAERPETAKDFQAPRSEMEEIVAGLWRDVLGLERVGIHDNFFEIGGHSLAMVRIRERLASELPRPASPDLVAMFQYPTVYQLAHHLSSSAAGGPAEDQALARVQAARQGNERQRARARLERRRRMPVPQ